MKFEEVFGEDVKNMSMWQLAHNSYFVKEVDGKREAWYRNYTEEISCRDLVRKIVVDNELQGEVSESFMTNDELFDEEINDFLQYDTNYIMYVIAMYYQAMWAFAETRQAAINPDILERKAKDKKMKIYDPNIFSGTHVIRVTLQQCEYKGHIWVEMGGNCKGLDLITGFNDYFECEEGDFNARNDCDLKEEDGYWTCVLKDENGNELEIEEPSSEMNKLVVAIEFESYNAE